MFSYYGSKSKIIKYYPGPKYNTIIEPFSGSARYALRFYDKNCWINDSYQVIYDIWTWIVQLTEEDINNIPVLLQGDNLDTLDIDYRLKYFLGFVVNSGVQSPRKTVTKWCVEKGEFKRHIERLRNYCGKLKHWKITNIDYRDIPNIEATWYVDAPYQNVTEFYKKHSIDYLELADWCRSRKGQVIACENSKADWLPFRSLKEMYGQRHKTTEVIWTN